MTQSSRRQFLKTSAVSAVAVTGVSGITVDSARAQSMPQQSSVATKANYEGKPQVNSCPKCYLSQSQKGGVLWLQLNI